MAEALEALYPGIKFGIGPPVDNGFYYDVDPGGRQISSEDFEKIEQKIIVITFVEQQGECAISTS